MKLFYLFYLDWGTRIKTIDAIFCKLHSLSHSNVLNDILIPFIKSIVPNLSHLHRSLQGNFANLRAHFNVVQPFVLLRYIFSRHNSGIGSNVIKIGCKRQSIIFHPINVGDGNVGLVIYACLQTRQFLEYDRLIYNFKASLVGGKGGGGQIFWTLDFPNNVSLALSLETVSFWL